MSDSVGDEEAGVTDRYAHLVEHIQDAVVEFQFVDGNPVVRDVNQAFVDVFGYERDAIRGDSLNDWIVPAWLREEADALDERTAGGEINYQRVKRETASGLREFLYRSVPYADDRAGTGGYALYTDLTQISRSERRVRVMNRVLRHNLRNKTTLILAHTARLLDDFDEQRAERTASAAALEGAAHDLERLTEEADRIRRILDEPVDADDGVDCVPLVERVTETHRGRAPHATIETALPESAVVRVNDHLEAALDSLVENAVEHNPADAPRVRVTVTEHDGWTTVAVDDDGPLIPETERDVVTGDADITPTRHASGLGLWLVAWTTELFGGKLSFERSTLGGNRVRVRLPTR